MQRNQIIQDIVDGMGQFKRLFHASMLQNFKRLEISPSQLELLQVIHQSEPINHKTLARKVQLTPGAVSQLLDGLDSAQCIVRAISPTDRRTSFISLSRIGKRKLEDFQKLRKQTFASAFNVLTDEELQTYLEVQKKLTDWFNKQQTK